MTRHLPTRAQTTRFIGVALGATALLGLTTVLSRADDGDPRKILKSMSDYLAARNPLSATYDSDIEVVTPDLRKIQFAASGALLWVSA